MLQACIAVEHAAHVLLLMPMSAVQGIREETRREQSAELKQGNVKWEVEVSLLQINLCSATAAGRFLLAAQKCQLSGSQLPASQRKALCIDMQARALCQPSHMLPGAHDEVLAAGDPVCHTCWLRPAHSQGAASQRLLLLCILQRLMRLLQRQSIFPCHGHGACRARGFD